MTRRLPAAVVMWAWVALGASSSPAQSLATDAPAPSRGGGGSPPADAASAGDRQAWEFSASVYGYILADAANYLQPSITADRGWLHLEARYNYESQRTGSSWIGYNFSGGRSVTWELTPMLGLVFGGTDGVAPGYRGSIGWRKLAFTSEGEYVIASDSADRFLYNWSELSLAPRDWIRFGLATQRTRAYQSARDIQRGLLLGLSLGRLDVTTYVLNPDDSAPTVILAAVVSF